MPTAKARAGFYSRLDDRIMEVAGECTYVVLHLECVSHHLALVRGNSDLAGQGDQGPATPPLNESPQFEKCLRIAQTLVPDISS